MNESFTLRNRLLQGGKRVFKRDSNVPHYSGFQGSTSNGRTKVTNVKQIWVKKNELNCLVVHTALRASESHSWYFDSGCSRHMTGNRSFFTNFIEFDGGNVTFGDGNVVSVKGKSIICAPGIPNLEEVLYVEGLKANLISISQICDKKFNVQFSQNLCKVFDLKGNCVMIGLRTSDNCYAVYQNPSTSFFSFLVCGSSKIESIDLWHRRLGHLNYRDLMKVANNDVIKGIPKLGKLSNPICGPCQKGKQTRSTHKRVDEILTFKPLELLHMDLMGPMRTESLRDKKYILVMVDDYSRVFGSRCYVLKDHENLGKFESKSEEGIFLGYSSKSRAYRVYILSSKCMVESINVIVDDLGSRSRECDDDRIDVTKDIEDSMVTRRQSKLNEVSYVCYTSQIEPKNVEEALNDEAWVEALHEELNQFSRNDVWFLVPRPKDVNVIGTKWIFKNKMDENGVIVRNKARLESIRILLAIACVWKFKLFQMDVKSAFLNGILNEEVYVEQPKGFQDPRYPNHFYRLRKALYGLKQAPRAWLERLTSYFLKKGFMRGGVDRTLFIRRNDEVFLVAQIYVDDIVFGSTSSECALDFAKEMKNEFEMSMVGELTYFLGFQVKQLKDGIFLSQSKYARELVKKFGLELTKHFRTPLPTNLKLSKDESEKRVEETLYRSMIGSLLYLTTSRLDITFSVGMCARYQTCPKESHLIALKHIIRYIAGSLELGFWYPFDTHSDVACYIDADWAGNVDDRKTLQVVVSILEIVWLLG
ncbi:Retrovirus-related Pol polyprotein from transposon RE1 [Vitis vinifera]|uniref:Retrovirus-related Pol polyprotein from transposon RE1 n=1 Tax=Vitis vinifera TaxID=29760 RepID=A0A438JFP7_VITVI|nr:Retrovirus-related Pol polyprotein from transposon RE1 [Vitis vinifera]